RHDKSQGTHSLWRFSIVRNRSLDKVVAFAISLIDDIHAIQTTKRRPMLPAGAGSTRVEPAHAGRSRSRRGAGEIGQGARSPRASSHPENALPERGSSMQPDCGRTSAGPIHRI